MLQLNFIPIQLLHGISFSMVIHIGHIHHQKIKTFHQFRNVKSILMQIQFYREHIINSGFVTIEGYL